MEAKELMIGDWVNVNGLNLKVGAIHADEIGVFDPDYKIYWCSDDGLDRIDPIPLTEEILEKNGFTYEEDTFLPDTGYWSLSNEDGLLYFTINAFGVKGSGEVAFGYQDIALKYVHQLQHLLRLCNIDKEISI